MALPTSIGRYRILGLLGKGAMGVVYRGLDETLDREVAIKMMSAAHSEDADAQKRFLREARAAARLQHPNIVTIYELGDHHGTAFIAMELMEGRDLQQAIKDGLRPNPRATVPIVLQVLSGLAHAHEAGVVHRDIKPSNVFLPRGRQAKLMDFGIARLGGGATSTGQMVGTPNYMSPEQVQGAVVDGRSDLFSTALILYELVTGEKAYQADSIVSLLFKISTSPPNLALIPPDGPMAGLRRVLERGLAHSPSDRYPDARSMEADLARALEVLGGPLEAGATADRAAMRQVAPPTPPPAPTPPALATAAPDAWGDSPTIATPAPDFTRRAPPPAAPTPPPPALDTVEWSNPAEPTAERTARRRPPPAPARPAPPRAPEARGNPLPAVAALLGFATVAVAAFFLWKVVGTTPPVPTLTPAPVTSAPVTSAPSPAPAASAAPTTTVPAVRPSARPSAAPSPPGPAASPPAPKGSVQAHLDKGNALFDKGRYSAALAEARAVLKAEPDNVDGRQLAEDAEMALAVELRIKAARDCMARGDHEGALKHVRDGLVIAPSDARLIQLFRQLNEQ